MLNQISQRRILVVDPDPSVRELMRCLLSSDGHHVEEAHSSEQAQHKLDQERFDVVLTSQEHNAKQTTMRPAVDWASERTPFSGSELKAASAFEEIRRFIFNPFDWGSIQQVLEAIQQIGILCTEATPA